MSEPAYAQPASPRALHWKPLALVTVILLLLAVAAAVAGYVWLRGVSLRYSYARFFERETSLRLPVAMSLAC
jgi:hypothetical protein